jgi:hypothetical protein
MQSLSVRGRQRQRGAGGASCLSFVGATSLSGPRSKCSVTTIASWPCSTSSSTEHNASGGPQRCRCPPGHARLRAGPGSRVPYTVTATPFRAPPPPTPTDSDTATEALVRKGLASRVSFGSAAGTSNTTAACPRNHQRKANARDGAFEPAAAIKRTQRMPPFIGPVRISWR